MTDNLDAEADILSLLDQTLEAFGADASRWPEILRDRLMAFTCQR